jgi:hypothetical protein
MARRAVIAYIADDIPVNYRTSLVLALSVLVFGLQGCGNEGGQNLGGKPTTTTVAVAPTEKLVTKDWAPRETEQALVFNPQPTGKSALWVLVDGVREHPDTKITFDNKPMEDIAITDKVVTGAAPLSFIETPGPKEIVIVEGGTGRRVVVGTFMVKPKASN